MVVAICSVLLTAPKCIFLPAGGGYLKYPTERNSSYVSSTDWDIVVKRSIIILLIGGFLVLITKKKAQEHGNYHSDNPDEKQKLVETETNAEIQKEHHIEHHPQDNKPQKRYNKIGQIVDSVIKWFARL